MIRSRAARKGALVGAKQSLRMLALKTFWERDGMGRNAYLVRCHIKVHLGGTRWTRFVPAVLVNCLARED